MKKYLILFLLISLNLNCFADSPIWTWKADYLAENWIINNNSDNPDDYRLWDPITRRETMKIIIKLAWIEVQDKCEWKFKDVKSDDWWCKYIETALNSWYITKNESFRPNDNITKSEVLKLIFKAKNISKIQETTNWQEDYEKTAIYYKIITDDFKDYDSVAKRWWIFAAVANALNIK